MKTCFSGNKAFDQPFGASLKNFFCQILQQIFCFSPFFSFLQLQTWKMKISTSTPKAGWNIHQVSHIILGPFQFQWLNEWMYVSKSSTTAGRIKVLLLRQDSDWWILSNQSQRNLTLRNLTRLTCRKYFKVPKRQILTGFLLRRRNRKGRNKQKIKNIFLLRLFYCGNRIEKAQ